MRTLGDMKLPPRLHRQWHLLPRELCLLVGVSMSVWLNANGTHTRQLAGMRYRMKVHNFIRFNHTRFRRRRALRWRRNGDWARCETWPQARSP